MSQPKFMESLNLVVHHVTASTTFPTHHSKQSFFWGVTSPRVPRHLAFHWCRSSYIRFGGATTAATTMEEGEFHDLRSKTLYLLTSILSLRHWQGKHEPTKVVFCWLKQKDVSPRFSVRRTLSKNFGWLLMKRDKIAISAKLWSWCVSGPTNLYLYFRNRSQVKTKLKTQLGKFTFQSFIHHAPKNIVLENICCKWKKALEWKSNKLRLFCWRFKWQCEPSQMTIPTVYSIHSFENIKSTTQTLQLLGAEIFKMKMLLDLRGKQIGSKRVYDWLVFQLTTTCSFCKKKKTARTTRNTDFHQVTASMATFVNKESSLPFFRGSCIKMRKRLWVAEAISIWSSELAFGAMGMDG